MNTQIATLNKLQLPVVKIEKKLNKLEKKVFFPEKLAQANRILKTVGLPVRNK
jgi:hypothetical protein